MKRLGLFLILLTTIGISIFSEEPSGPFETGIDFYSERDNEGTKSSKVTAEVSARAGLVNTFDFDAAANGKPAYETKNVLEADVRLNFNLGSLKVFETQGIYGYLDISNLLTSTSVTAASYSNNNHAYYNGNGYPSMMNGQIVYSEHTPSITGMLGSATYEAKVVMGDMFLQLAGNGMAMSPTAIRSGFNSIKSSFMAMEMLGGINWTNGSFVGVDFGMLNGVAYNHGGLGGVSYPTTGNFTVGYNGKGKYLSLSVGAESMVDPDSNNNTGELSGSIPFKVAFSFETPAKINISGNFASAYRSDFVVNEIAAGEMHEDLEYKSAANRYEFGLGLKISGPPLKPFAGTDGAAKSHTFKPYISGSLNKQTEDYEDEFTRLAEGTAMELYNWSVGTGFTYITGTAAYVYDVAGFNDFCGYDVIGTITKANIVDEAINFGVLYDSTKLLQAKLSSFSYNLIPNSSIGFLAEIEDVLEERVNYLGDPLGKRMAVGIYYDYNLYNKLRPFIWGKYIDNYVKVFDNGINQDVREENGYFNSVVRFDTGNEIIVSAGVQADIIKHLRVVASWKSGNLLRQSSTVYDIFSAEDVDVPMFGVFTLSAMVNL